MLLFVLWIIYIAKCQVIRQTNVNQHNRIDLYQTETECEALAKYTDDVEKLRLGEERCGLCGMSKNDIRVQNCANRYAVIMDHLCQMDDPSCHTCEASALQNFDGHPLYIDNIKKSCSTGKKTYELNLKAGVAVPPVCQSAYTTRIGPIDIQGPNPKLCTELSNDDATLIRKDPKGEVGNITEDVTGQQTKLCTGISKNECGTPSKTTGPSSSGERWVFQPSNVIRQGHIICVAMLCPSSLHCPLGHKYPLCKSKKEWNEETKNVVGCCFASCKHHPAQPKCKSKFVQSPEEYSCSGTGKTALCQAAQAGLHAEAFRHRLTGITGIVMLAVLMAW
eukprot:GHVL01020574.1.p1 GENE.GHVL01020574.1~~GHVL01020574.1.p1  ORF type:complete len:335 (+),score=47.97 GHVL01020574.1:70-1074(+)